MSISLALADFIPVGIFLYTSVILQRGLYNKMSKGAFAVFSCGTIFVFVAGLYKAIWKLLFCAGICDFEQLSISMMPMQGTGFLLAGAGLVAMLAAKQETENEPLYAVAAPAVFSGTMIFVCFDVLGIIAIGTCLSIVAKRIGKKAAVPFFIIAVIGMIMMGYLASKDFTKPIYNWIAEIVNTLAQGSLLIGSVMLKKAGLQEFRFRKT